MSDRVTLSPKVRFQANKDFVRLWQDITVASVTHAAVEAALCEMLVTCRLPNELGTAAANEYRYQGAKVFIDILLNLTNTSQPSKARLPQNLDHQA